MKKEYITPSMEAITLKISNTLLAGSGNIEGGPSMNDGYSDSENWDS